MIYSIVFFIFCLLFSSIKTEDSIIQECQHCNRTFRNRTHPREIPHKFLPTDDELKAIDTEFPSHFDWCEEGYCVPSWNQHIPVYCGSCFLHGSLSSAQDRIKLWNKRKYNFTGPDVILGRQSYLNCAPGHGFSEGCNGGEPVDVYEFMRQYGLPDETCLPYNATDHTKYPNGTCPPMGYCMDCMSTPESPKEPTCFPVTKMIRYRAKSYGNLNGIYNMMKEILENGPITCGIACNQEFVFNYTAGIFHDKTNFLDIDHDVEIVGWGEDQNGTKYWNVRNSWGTYWGMNGFFKIIRGTNNLGIESDCHYMIPEISQEELVWEQKDGYPKYGGSLWGIKPFKEINASEESTSNKSEQVVSIMDDIMKIKDEEKEKVKKMKEEEKEEKEEEKEEKEEENEERKEEKEKENEEQKKEKKKYKHLAEKKKKKEKEEEYDDSKDDKESNILRNNKDAKLTIMNNAEHVEKMSKFSISIIGLLGITAVVVAYFYRKRHIPRYQRISSP